MKMNDLMVKVLEILPNALFDESVDGELIIATGFSVDKFDNLIDVMEVLSDEHVEDMKRPLDEEGGEE